MKITVLIPTYNKDSYLAPTLESLARQDFSDWELLLVDDGSTDQTSRIVESYGDRFRAMSVLRQGNSGRSAARNAAIPRASGELVVFCDDDRIVPPNFLAAHWEAYQRAECSKVATLGPHSRIVSHWSATQLPSPDPSLKAWLEHHQYQEAPNDGLLFDLAQIGDFDGLTEQFGLPEPYWLRRCLPLIQLFRSNSKMERVLWTIGISSNLGVSRNLLEEVGGFEERFRGWGVEDNDFCFRLHKAGAVYAYAAEAVSWHQLHAYGSSKYLEAIRNLRIFNQKHQDAEAGVFVKLSTRQLSDSQAYSILLELEELSDGPLKDEFARLTRREAEHFLELKEREVENMGLADDLEQTLARKLSAHE